MESFGVILDVDGFGELFFDLAGLFLGWVEDGEGDYGFCDFKLGFEHVVANDEGVGFLVGGDCLLSGNDGDLDGFWFGVGGKGGCIGITAHHYTRLQKLQLGLGIEIGPGPDFRVAFHYTLPGGDVIA